MTYSRTADSAHYLPRTGSHSTKGSRRGFIRDDYVKLRRAELVVLRDKLHALRRPLRLKITEAYARRDHAEASDRLGPLNRRLKRAAKALDAYSFLISEYVDQDPGDHRDVELFEKTVRFSKEISAELDAVEQEWQAKWAE